MRKRQNFLLTVLSSENEDASFCGRLKIISSGKMCTFTNLEELYGLIKDEMDETLPQEIDTQGIDPNYSRKDLTNS